MDETGVITTKLAEWRKGDSKAFDTLITLVYDDLRSIARQQLARLRPGQTLNTTALVNESYAKIRSGDELNLRDRQHFFAVAACAMRQIIVDEARSRMSAKRTGTEISIDLDHLPTTIEERSDQIVLVDQLLNKLEKINPELVRLVECRFYAGYTLTETAETLNLSVRTAQRRWQRANTWLRELVRM